MFSLRHKLIALLDRGPIDSPVGQAYVQALVDHGTGADVEPLFEAFLGEPARRGFLLEAVMARGDLTIAERIWQVCTDGKKLRSEMPDEVLHALGYLGYHPAERLLFRYVLEGSHSAARRACLGLLHMPCHELAREIGDAVRTCFGRNLFPEFIPALATKANDPSLLEGIFELGATAASTDCNGGIVLGTALFGASAHQQFDTILWDPHWEADGQSTGTAYFTHLGARIQGVTIAEIAGDLRRGRAVEAPRRRPDPAYPFGVLATLVDFCLEGAAPSLRFLPPATETVFDFYRLLFKWSNPHHDDSVIALARTALGREHPVIDRLYLLDQQTRTAMGHATAIEQLAACRLGGDLPVPPR